MKPVIFNRRVYLMSDRSWRLLLVSLAAGEPADDLEERFGARFVAGPCLDVGSLDAGDARALLDPASAAALDVDPSAPPTPPQPRRLYKPLRTSDKLKPKAKRAPAQALVTHAIAQLMAIGYRVTLQGRHYTVFDPDGNRVFASNSEGLTTTTLDSRMLVDFAKERL